MTKTGFPKLPNVSLGHETVAARVKVWSEKIACFSMLAAFPAILASTSHAAVSQLVPDAGLDNCPGKQIPRGNYTAARPYVDTGDTTGANNTNNSFDPYYSGYLSEGPDNVYSFTLKAYGPNPRIEVVAANPSQYKPLIYVGNHWGGCPAGTSNENLRTFYAYNDTRYPGSDGQVSLQFVPLNERVFVFVDSQLNDSLGSGVYTFKLHDVTVAYPPHANFITSGYGSNAQFFRPAESTWYVDPYNSWRPNGVSPRQFGLPTDRIVPGDYDNDGRIDIGVFRSGEWWWLNSHDATISVLQFGIAGDIPVPADYTGDGRDDIAIYRNGQWWSLDLTNNQPAFAAFGSATDKPVPADYDGDGKADAAVFRDGAWWILRTTGGHSVQQWGSPGDKPVPGDYDGDNKTDLAIFRDGQWWILSSTGDVTVQQLGLAGDIPVPADYDSDGRTDAAVVRNGTWFFLTSRYVNRWDMVYGQAGDKPLQAAYIQE